MKRLADMKHRYVYLIALALTALVYIVRWLA